VCGPLCSAPPIRSKRCPTKPNDSQAVTTVNGKAQRNNVAWLAAQSGSLPETAKMGKNVPNKLHNRNVKRSPPYETRPMACSPAPA
jgi:hypothetical protein